MPRRVTFAAEAGAIALGFFEPGGKTRAGVEWKGDGSPVTEADYAVNAFLEPRLKALWPGAAWLSEDVTSILDRAPRSFEQFARELAEAFTAA